MLVNLGTIEVPDSWLRAVRAHHGKPGSATRQEFVDFYLSHADADMEVIVSEMEAEEEHAATRQE